MTTDKGESRTIRIKNKTYLGIRKLGYMGETFDDVLQRMLQLEKEKADRPPKFKDKIA
jgi:hypothetical protein